MTTEDKALALLNDLRTERGFAPVGELYGSVLLGEALCRAIEQHETFRQEVSDAAQEVTEIIEHWSGDRDGAKCLQDFIIPKPQPDPLVDVLTKAGWGLPKENAEEIRAALDALGFEIREKNDR